MENDFDQVSGPHEVLFVGTGGIAGVQAESVARLGGRAKVTAAVDIDPARLAAFAERWDVPRTYPDLDSALVAERPSLVHLCTPPGLHREQATACLLAGLDVLCEKPPALSLAELDEIAAAERASAGQFACVFQHRFGSRARALRALLADGTLGRPLTAVCDTLWYRPDDYFDPPWRGRWATEGGGPTMGHGIHQMDLLLSVLGRWTQVVAVAARQARPTETEDLSAAVVTFASGAVATVVNSLLSPRETSYLRFDTERATVEVEHLYGYDDRSWRVTPAPGHEERVAAAWAAAPSGQGSGHHAQIAAVLDAKQAGRPLPVALAAARHTMELVAAIYASAFTGRPVRAGEITAGHPFHRRMDGPGAPWAGTPAAAGVA